MALLAMFVKWRNNCFKIQKFLVLYDKKVTGFKKRDMIQNVKEKIVEKLNFVGESNFLGVSAEAAVCRCSCVNS